MQKGAGRKNSAMYCVIVGDIINSKEIVEPERREALLRAAKGVFSSINAKYYDALLADFGVVRGDGFEGVLLAKYLAPKIIREIIKGLYRAEKTRVRIAAVVGELSSVSNDRNECDGPAFHRALGLLEALKKRKSERWLQIAFDAGETAQPLIDSLLGLLGALAGGWTEKQREIVWAMEHSQLQIRTAAISGVKPAVISKQLKAANYEEYRNAWESLEDYLIIADEARIALYDETRIVVTNKAGTEEEPVVDGLACYNVALKAFDDFKLDRVVSLFGMALEWAKQTFGTEDVRLIPFYDMLALSLVTTGEALGAEEALGASFKLREGLSKVNIRYIGILLAVALIAAESERYEKAKELMKYALKLAENSSEKDDNLLIGIKEFHILINNLRTSKID